MYFTTRVHAYPPCLHTTTTTGPGTSSLNDDHASVYAEDDDPHNDRSLSFRNATTSHIMDISQIQPCNRVHVQ